jgi:hypothetical protein
MPAYQLQEIFLRIGLALGAGILIGAVPLAWRLGRFEPSRAKRITFQALAVLAFLCFCLYAWYLWQRFAPRAAPVPEPVAYPVVPASL